MTMNSFSFRAERQSRRPYEDEISELLNLHQDGEVFPTEFLKNTKSLIYQPLDFSSLKEEWEDRKGQRLAPRFDMQITVLVANHLKAFRTQTINLSMRGLLLKDVLPIEFSKNNFDVVLIYNDLAKTKSFLLFRGKSVGQRLLSRRVQFDAVTPGAESKLGQLIKGLLPK